MNSTYKSMEACFKVYEKHKNVYLDGCLWASRKFQEIGRGDIADELLNTLMTSLKKVNVDGHTRSERTQEVNR